MALAWGLARSGKKNLPVKAKVKVADIIFRLRIIISNYETDYFSYSIVIDTLILNAEA